MHKNRFYSEISANIQNIIYSKIKLKIQKNSFKVHMEITWTFCTKHFVVLRAIDSSGEAERERSYIQTHKPTNPHTSETNISVLKSKCLSHNRTSPETVRRTFKIASASL